MRGIWDSVDYLSLAFSLFKPGSLSPKRLINNNIDNSHFTLTLPTQSPKHFSNHQYAQLVQQR